MAADPPPPGWRSYEELTQDLIGRIGAADGIATLRLERDVLMPGRANPNRIDVVWESADESQHVVRLLFECRSYRRRITQQAMHSWRGVVDDVAADGVETVGVMVTSTGYQLGAQRVADTYGIVICELRAPTPGDLANRVTSIGIDLVIRAAHVTDLSVKATEQLGPNASLTGQLGDFLLDLGDGRSERLADHLLRGELAPLSEPVTTSHSVTRRFVPPVTLRRGEELIARVWEVTGTVSESEAPPVRIETRAAEIAWMLANSLTGTHTWFAADGRIWQTPG